MDKYTLLLILNLPFVIFGTVRALVMYKEGLVRRLGLIIRFLFWGTVLFGLIFAEEIYSFLSRNNLSDTSPLSLAEVVLTTGFLLCFTLAVRLYSKTETLEKRLSDLHEEISINNSKNKN
jgi:hypothetical protein